MSDLAIVTGVGPGTGAAIARRFAADGNRVAMIARNAERLAELEAELPGARGFVCDVADSAALLATLAEIENWGGTPRVVVHNAVGGAFGKIADIAPEVIEGNFRTNVMALFHIAQWAAPRMVAAEGDGALIVTGNTSALRGKAHFAGFAPTKAAQRILAEAIARDYGPQGLHVAYLVIDAVIDVPWARERFPDAPQDFFISPADIADEVHHLAHQSRSAWSFLAEVRPYAENW